MTVIWGNVTIVVVSVCDYNNCYFKVVVGNDIEAKTWKEKEMVSLIGKKIAGREW